MIPHRGMGVLYDVALYGITKFLVGVWLNHNLCCRYFDEYYLNYHLSANA